MQTPPGSERTRARHPYLGGRLLGHRHGAPPRRPVDEETTAQAIQLYTEYDPQPPFDSGSMGKASPEVLERVVALGLASPEVLERARALG